jgi:hypothetical protein
MRSLSPLLLFLFALSASADCTPSLVLQAGGAINGITMHEGLIDYSLFFGNDIRRLDPATGRTAILFATDEIVDRWTIKEGFLALTILKGPGLPTGSRPTELLLVAPDGSIRRIAEAEPESTGPHIGGFEIHDGYLYWLQTSSFDVAGGTMRADGLLRRTALGGMTAETIAIGLRTDQTFSYRIAGDRLLLRSPRGIEWQPLSGGAPVLLVPRSDIASFAGFEQRLVFSTADGLYWLPLEGGVPVRLLARSDIQGIGSITADAILVSTATPFNPSVATAQLLCVPWWGAPAETVYEATVNGIAPNLSVGGIVAGATTYVVRVDIGHFFWRSASIFARRDHVTRQIFATGGEISVLAADEEGLTIGYRDAGGLRKIYRLCNDRARSRAVR